MKKIQILLLIFFLFPLISLGQEELDFDSKKAIKTSVEMLFKRMEASQDTVKVWTFEYASKDSTGLAKHLKNLDWGANILNKGVRFEEESELYIGTMEKTLTYTREILTKNLISESKTLKKFIKWGQEPIHLHFVGYSYDNPDEGEEIITYVNSIDIEGVKIQGKVVSQNEGLSYVSLGIIGKNVGTISDTKGDFSLAVLEENLEDTLTISMIGYEKKQIPIKKLLQEKDLIINLNNDGIVLDEVEVPEDRLGEKITLGQKEVSDTYGFIYGEGAGAEIGRIINPKRKKVFLNTVAVNIGNLKKTGFTLLLNIYAIDPLTKLPSKSLLKEQVVITSSLPKGWLEVNMNKHHIIFDKPVLVAFQWVDEDVKNPMINLKGPKRYSFSRHTALGKWQHEGGGFNYTIKAEVTELKEEK